MRPHYATLKYITPPEYLLFYFFILGLPNCGFQQPTLFTSLCSFLKQYIWATNKLLICYLLKNTCTRPRVGKWNPERQTFLFLFISSHVHSSIWPSLYIMPLCCAQPGLHTKQETHKPAAGLKSKLCIAKQRDPPELPVFPAHHPL